MAQRSKPIRLPEFIARQVLVGHRRSTLRQILGIQALMDLGFGESMTAVKALIT